MATVQHRNTGDYRDRDLLGRLYPRRALADAVTMLRAIPNLGGAFERRVPGSHLSDAGVHCPCGVIFIPPVAQITGCPGACGRYYLFVDDGHVRVARGEI